MVQFLEASMRLLQACARPMSGCWTCRWQNGSAYLAPPSSACRFSLCTAFPTGRCVAAGESIRFVKPMTVAVVAGIQVHICMNHAGLEQLVAPLGRTVGDTVGGACSWPTLGSRPSHNSRSRAVAVPPTQAFIVCALAASLPCFQASCQGALPDTAVPQHLGALMAAPAVWLMHVSGRRRIARQDCTEASTTSMAGAAGPGWCTCCSACRGYPCCCMMLMWHGATPCAPG